MLAGLSGGDQLVRHHVAGPGSRAWTALSSGQDRGATPARSIDACAGEDTTMYDCGRHAVPAITSAVATRKHYRPGGGSFNITRGEVS